MKKVEEKAKTFSLCVFSEYKVEYSCEYSYLNENRDFIDSAIKESYEIDGGRLSESLAKLILDGRCIEFVLLENEIHISHFDPMSGESADYVFKIKETGNHVFEEKKEKR